MKNYEKILKILLTSSFYSTKLAGMESLKKMNPLFTAIITFCAVFTALGFMFNVLLNPVKTNLVRLESEIKSVETELKAEIKSVKTELNSRMDRIETKLDLLLSDKRRRPASSDSPTSSDK